MGRGVQHNPRSIFTPEMLHALFFLHTPFCCMHKHKSLSASYREFIDRHKLLR